MVTLQQFVDSCEAQETIKLQCPGEAGTTRNLLIRTKRSQIFFLYGEIQEVTGASQTDNAGLTSPYKLRVSLADGDIEKSFPFIFAICVGNCRVVRAFKLYSPPTKVYVDISEEEKWRYTDCSQWTIYLKVDPQRDIDEGNISNNTPYFYPSDSHVRQLVIELQSMLRTQAIILGRKPLHDIDCGPLAPGKFLGVTGRYDASDPFGIRGELYISQNKLSQASGSALAEVVDELTRKWLMRVLNGITIPISQTSLTYLRAWNAQVSENPQAQAWYPQKQKTATPAAPKPVN